MIAAVTGASGFIGNVVCTALIKISVRLKVLTRTQTDQFAGLDVEVIKGDILDVDSLAKVFDGVDVVFHLAASISIGDKDFADVYAANVAGTKNVIDQCKKFQVKKLIHFSTIHTFQNYHPDEVLDESNPIISNPKFAYETSKADAEHLIIEAAKNGLDAVILNPTAVIGPFDFRPSYLGLALLKFYTNNLPMLVSGGYNFVDVRDVADAAIEAATAGRKGERYILSGHWLSLKELSVKTGRITRRKSAKMVAPNFLVKAGIPFLNVWAKLTGAKSLLTAESLDILQGSARNISNLKARNELGYNPRPIDETLADTYEWFKQHHYFKSHD